MVLEFIRVVGFSGKAIQVGWVRVRFGLNGCRLVSHFIEQVRRRVEGL